MIRRTLYLLILFTLHASLFTPVFAQRRQIADAEALLKKGKDFAKVEKMMTELLKDSANHDNLRIYDVWLESVERQYGELNEKMYKRQAVDTTQLFTLTRRIFTVAERLDSLDMRPDKKGRVDLQYRKGNAQRLRREMTKEERHLWYDFFKTMGIHANRQKPIGPYIVDFYIASAGLVIELDGGQHYEEAGKEHDEIRDRFLREQRLTVLRYSNLDINRNFSGVCEDILEKLRG